MNSGTGFETVYLTADTVVLGERDGHLHALVARRSQDPYKGYWVLPGGHVDAGEDTEDAARRELAERTGLHVGWLRFVNAYAKHGRDPRGRHVTFAYATLLGHTPTRVAAGAAAAEWVLVNELMADSTRVGFDHKQIIHDALRVAL